MMGDEYPHEQHTPQDARSDWLFWPCFFPVVETDDKGKQKKTYLYKEIMTPYDKLKSLPHADHTLKPTITFEQLDKVVSEMSDNEAAKRMSLAKQQLFKTIFGQEKPLSPLSLKGD